MSDEMTATRAKAQLEEGFERMRPTGLFALSDAYTDLRIRLGMRDIEIARLARENTEACAHAERLRQAFASGARERMERTYRLHRLECELAELRAMLYQFVVAQGEDKETARAFLVAEAVSYRRSISGAPPADKDPTSR